MTGRPCEVCGGGDFRELFVRNDHHFCRCRSCRLVRIDPQPTDEVLAEVYSNQYFKAWGGEATSTGLKTETFRRHLLPAAQLAAGARVLDCGAAFGALMEEALAAGLEPYGVELVADAAATIARRFGSERVFAGPFEQATFAQPFDAVFMCDFIEHVRDPVGVLKKAHSLLRAGGQLVITTPDTGTPSGRCLGRLWPHYNVEHLFCFDRQNLHRLLTATGFAGVRSTAAQKMVTLEYLGHHLNARPRPWVTAVFNSVARLAGPRLRQWPMSFTLGQMLVVASRV